MSRIPNFSQIEFADAPAAETAAAAAAAAPWLTPEGVAVESIYTAEALKGLDAARHLSGHRALSARPLPDHVRHPAMDDPAICRLLDR